jgi:hypothetical protein
MLYFRIISISMHLISFVLESQNYYTIKWYVQKIV